MSRDLLLLLIHSLLLEARGTFHSPFTVAASIPQVLKMEQKILKFFNFRITMPTINTFLVRYLKVAQGSAICGHRANYFTERALQEHEVLQWQPSLVAASAVYLAKRNETLDAWVRQLFLSARLSGVYCQ